jgi:integrase
VNAASVLPPGGEKRLPTKLTPKNVDAMRPTDQIVNVRDTVAPGLELRIFPSGEKRWAVRYRVGNRQRRLTLGDVANIPLGGKGGARDLARKALLQVANGRDPMAEKRQRREADTVGEFAQVYMDEYARKKKRSWRNDLALIEHEILPAWKHRLMREITRRDVRDLLKSIADRPAPIYANRVRACLSKMFQFALVQEVVETNPVRDTERPGQERVRERVLSPEEIRTFWAHTETLELPLQTMWRLRLYTAQRPQEEVAQIQWGEIDLDGGWWTIPSAKAKNKLTHRVPLTEPAVKLLRAIRPAKVDPEAFVFQGFTRDSEARTGKRFPLPDFQPRDLRKTARTRMGEDGVPEEWAEAVLNHKKPGIAGVYNLHKYDAEKRKALEHWARRIDAILNKTEGARVLPFAQTA